MGPLRKVVRLGDAAGFLQKLNLKVCFVYKGNYLKNHCIVTLGFKTVPLDTPYCFYPPNYNTYKIVNVSNTAFGLVAYLNRSYRTAYPDDVAVLQMTVKYETEDRLHVKVLKQSSLRWWVNNGEY